MARANFLYQLLLLDTDGKRWGGPPVAGLAGRNAEVQVFQLYIDFLRSRRFEPAHSPAIEAAVWLRCH